MDVADAVLLEKVERLAFMAGAQSRSAEPAQGKQASPELKEALRRLEMVMKNSLYATGSCLYALQDENNFRWEDVRVILDQVKV